MTQVHGPSSRVLTYMLSTNHVHKSFSRARKNIVIMSSCESSPGGFRPPPQHIIDAFNLREQSSKETHWKRRHIMGLVYPGEKKVSVFCTNINVEELVEKNCFGGGNSYKTGIFRW